MNYFLCVSGGVYIIVGSTLLCSWLVDLQPDKLSKAVFWPIWIIVEIVLSVIEWYVEVKERYKEI